MYVACTYVCRYVCMYACMHARLHACMPVAMHVCESDVCTHVHGVEEIRVLDHASITVCICMHII